MNRTPPALAIDASCVAWPRPRGVVGGMGERPAGIAPAPI
jgi:hypothetical protein